MILHFLHGVVHGIVSLWGDDQLDVPAEHYLPLCPAWLSGARFISRSLLPRGHRNGVAYDVNERGQPAHLRRVAPTRHPPAVLPDGEGTLIQREEYGSAFARLQENLGKALQLPQRAVQPSCGAAIYRCTASAPGHLPVFVTVTLTPSAAAVKPEQANVV